MNIGRLAWRTPTGAMLWEIWGRLQSELPVAGNRSGDMHVFWPLERAWRVRKALEKF